MPVGAGRGGGPCRAGGGAAGPLGTPDLGISNLDRGLPALPRITDPGAPPVLGGADTGFGASAFHVARTGRCGPVLVDVPRDVQEAELDFSYPDQVSLPGWKPPRRGHQRQIAAAAQAVAAAERPILYVGGGAISRRSVTTGPTSSSPRPRHPAR